MIRILIGSSSTINKKCQDKYVSSKSAIWLEPSIDVDHFERKFFRYWAGIRSFLPQVRSLIGDHKFEKIALKHRLVSSVVLKKIEAEITEKEFVERQKYMASLDSNLSHNYFIQYLLLDAWVLFCKELIEDISPIIIIPEATKIDGPSLAIFRRLFQQFPDVSLSMLVGHNPRLVKKDVYDDQGNPILDVDQDGIVWGYTYLGVQSFLYSLKSLRGTEEVALMSIDEKENLMTAFSISQDKDDWDDNQGVGIIDQLINPEYIFSSTDTEYILKVLERSFQVYDFDTSLALGLRIYRASAEIEFSNKQRAFLHTLIGLSAHNRQFETFMAKESTNKFLEYHFNTALRYEEDPYMKGFLLYRMAVTKGRRQKKFEEAITWADRAVNAARDTSISPDKRGIMEAWSRNIRAYLYARIKNIKEAKKDITEAYRLIYVDALNASNIERELIFTASLIADNAATVADLSGDLVMAKEWLHKSDLIIGPHKSNTLFSPRAWIQVHRRMYRADMGVEAALLGLETARFSLHPFLEDLYLYNLGDLYYRLGDLELSENYYQQAISLHRKYHDLDREFTTLLRLSQVMIHKEDFEKAWEYIDQASQNPNNQHFYTKAEIAAMQAIIKASLGELSAVEEKINEAIDWSLKDGARMVLIQTSWLIAKTCRILEWNTELEKVLNNMATLIRSIEDGEEAKEKVLFLAWVEYLDWYHEQLDDKEKDDIISNILDNTLIALRAKSVAWWELSKLVKIVVQLPPTKLLSIFTQYEKTFLTMALVGEQQKLNNAAAWQKLKSYFTPSMQEKYSQMKKESDGTIMTGEIAQKNADRVRENLQEA